MQYNSRQNALPQCTVLLCNTGWQQACASAITPVEIHTAITPMKICCSYRSAVPPHQCTAVQFLAKCIAPLHNAFLQHRLTAGLCRCNHTFEEDSYSNHTYEDLLFIQVCSPTTPPHCGTNHGKMHCPTAQCCCATQAGSMLVPVQPHL